MKLFINKIIQFPTFHTSIIKWTNVSAIVIMFYYQDYMDHVYCDYIHFMIQANSVANSCLINILYTDLIQ